jgi:DNA topoisomerase-1
MAQRLVIVESPAKARTLGGFLGRQYAVKASVGHVRDLPKSRLGVDVQKDFTPTYLVPREKKKVVAELKGAAEKASAVYLATDPDREGEAISWHLVQAMGLDQDGKAVHRVVFHEVTKEAVARAFANPRDIDMALVQAQQARRIIDRLVGYKISPLLWKKVRGRLSAGRVQSVAVRLIVEREREIQAFVPQEYWSIEAELTAEGSRVRGRGSRSFRATLVGYLGKKAKLEIPDEKQAQALVADLREASYQVEGVSKKASQRQPAAPFTTSTLQQEAWRRLGFSAKRTMALAQQLYEGLPLGSEGTVGLITYMRTDSTQVASSAIAEVRELIKEKYGPSYLPSSPRRFGKKTPRAQEAHEAIRPTSVRREPETVRSHLTTDQFRLYSLIWRRMVASQMAAASQETTTVEVATSGSPSGHRYLLRASATTVTFPGFLAVYAAAKDDEEEGKKPLPPLAPGDPLRLLGLFPEQHFTQPPPRYSEASLVRTLEEKGIGRPSTYAPILSTIQERGYVKQVERRLQPTELGILVNDLLVEYFPEIVDVGFTAQMEEDLDEVARGEKEWLPLLREFYGPFHATVERAANLMKKVKPPEEVTDELCELCGRHMVIRHGRFGRFLACTGFPACRHTRSIVVKTGVACPRCEGELVQRRGKKGRPFYGCSRYPQCDFALPNRPLPHPCPVCGGLLAAYGARQAKCIQCGHRQAAKPAKEQEEAKLGT